MSRSDGAAGDVTEELNANIGLLGATAIGVGTMIAAGIFVLSGLAVSKIGTVAVVSFLIAALVASITAGAYAEFASVYQQSGGGYTYVDETFDTDLTYLMGWTMILGYPASAAFYLASFSSWFAEFIYPLAGISHAIGQLTYWVPSVLVLAALVALNVKGGEESNAFQIGVTGLKVALIAVFLYGGFQTFQADVVATSFAEHVGRVAQIGVTSALVFITFFGFSAIATNAEEITDPARTIPRAIYISIAFVIFVYTLVVLVIVLAVNSQPFKEFLAREAPAVADASGAVQYIATHGEVAMAYAAQYYLGDVGFYIIVAGALLSMLSAANATILAGSRVKLALARRGHLPPRFGELSDAGTPSKSVLLTGAFILIYLVVFTVLFGRLFEAFGLRLGVEGVTQFANALLIGGLTVVNAAVIVSRRRQPDLDRGFEVPLVPWVPAIGIVANLVMLYFVGATAVGMALIGELVGVAVWFAFISGRSEEEIEAETPTAITERHSRGHDRDYQLLVPIADPENVDQLMGTAVDLVRNGDNADDDGEILVLNAVETPRQTPLDQQRHRVGDRHREVVRNAMAVARENDVPVSGTVRYAHDPESAILNTAEQYGSESILMGWGGDRSRRRDIAMGSTVDDVVHEADANVFVEKVGGEASEEGVDSILLPTAGGPHAEYAEEIAGRIARANGAAVHAVRVLTPGDGTAEDAREQLAATEDTLEDDGVDVTTEVVEADDVVDALVDAAGDHDVTIIGSSRDSVFQRIVFGGIPEAVGDRVSGIALMIRRNTGARSRIRRYVGGD